MTRAAKVVECSLPPLVDSGGSRPEFGRPSLLPRVVLICVRNYQILSYVLELSRHCDPRQLGRGDSSAAGWRIQPSSWRRLPRTCA
jgi:hypothetical protein